MNNLEFLLSFIECKAPHPITCINPTEWFSPIDIRSEYGFTQNKIFVRGEETCWFPLDKCEVRNKVELPDAAELESWRLAATALRQRIPHVETIRAASLLENAYLFASKLIKE